MVAVARRKEKHREHREHRERCARCGKVISRKQVPSVWHNHVVCQHCHGKLRALEPAMALCKGIKLDLRSPNHPDRGATILHPGRILGRWVAAMKQTLHLS
jgi:hypothetical protein